MIEWLIIAAAVGLLAFGYDTLVARDIARERARKICQEHRVQLLDQTVAMRAVKLGRNDRGSLLLVRQYRFEFSTDGANRLSGEMLFAVKRFVSATIDTLDQGRIIVTPR